ncbi:deoxynucleoside triphosphate triphosphohydrolase SAMHD1-like isoform X1 [Lineus longissimus]|uniref:deoxynucleoside triphosphate triphosphohydrolase SAMHD1-like isoform X1 n=2 Tax=Lineus longissimus TaxID=88925 RepID=UPI002B4DDACA
MQENAKKRLRFDDNCKSSDKNDGQSVPYIADNYIEWGVEEVSCFLRSRNIEEDHIKLFCDEKITGRTLPDINEGHLEKIGVKCLGERLQILQVVKALVQTTVYGVTKRTRVLNDPIHGHIEMHPLLIKVMDNPQFQRLRFLKQLGGCYFVYPGASNNRFEHSLGVSHLAGELVRLLQKKQPELNITDKDVLCVQMAGLCHDIGHGPFSHLYDNKFLEVARPGWKWKHEDGSSAMFEHLIEVNNLKPEFARYGLADQDITFVKEMIAGSKKLNRHRDWPYLGRDKSKAFLYEVVANKRNGIDVDKWDYFARDCHHLGIQNSFDHVRYMKFMRVLKVDQDYQICARDKEVGNLYEMFHTRNILHQRAYQHKGKMVIEVMITEAMLKANDYLLIPGKDNKLLRMSEAMDDMVAFTQLTDHIFEAILYSTDPNLAESKRILTDIQCRRLYKCIGQLSPGERINIDEEISNRYRKEIIAAVPEEKLGGKPLKPENLIVQVARFDYGMKEKNPVDNVRFYRKGDPNTAFQLRKDEVSKMLPDTFAEQSIRVYCKLLDEESIAKAKQCFNSWREQNKMATSETGANEFTPIKSRPTPENPPPTPKTPENTNLSLAMD